jgi:uncharacterized protein YbjT (DUF2867 family)
MKKNAIILGATGLTGKFVLKTLLDDSRYDRVILFSRSPVGIVNEKIEEHIVDVLQLEQQKDIFLADEVFCCIGTTASKTPNKEKYMQIDYGIPVQAAKLSETNKIASFITVSAMGANQKSGIFYNRIKGRMERDVLACHIKNKYMLRPSLIGGHREEKRLGEYITKQLFKIANPIMLGPLKKYQSIAPEAIAKSMVWLANNEYPNAIIESDEIQQIAKK